MNRHLNNEGQEGNAGHVKGGPLWEGRVKGQIWLMYFLYRTEYGTLKPVEVTLRRGMG
jgi:hypothetical protein